MHKQHARAENREESGFCEVSLLFFLHRVLEKGPDPLHSKTKEEDKKRKVKILL